MTGGQHPNTFIIERYRDTFTPVDCGRATNSHLPAVQSRPEPEFVPKTGLNWPLVGGLTQFVSWVLRLGRVASRVLPVGLVYGQEAPRLAG